MNDFDAGNYPDYADLYAALPADAAHGDRQTFTARHTGENYGHNGPWVAIVHHWLYMAPVGWIECEPGQTFEYLKDDKGRRVRFVASECKLNPGATKTLGGYANAEDVELPAGWTLTKETSK